MNTIMLFAASVCLNGTWNFAFHEDKTIEDVAQVDFAATDAMVVPGCWDVMPRWYMKHGTGLYRRTFMLDAPMKDAVLVVDGMGIRGSFKLDDRDLGLHPYPYARLELPVGPLAAGEHTLFAAVDNVMEWPRVKLARPYYDFYFYGGFYHGVKLVEREPKVFVRTLDWKTRKVEVEVEKLGGWDDAKLKDCAVSIDGKTIDAAFTDNKAVFALPDATLWSPASPVLHTLDLTFKHQTSNIKLSTFFGLRQVEAKNRKILLNGEEVFLKGFNRHESFQLSGAATDEALMVQDLQRLKAVGGNFIRGAHYQQCERFLELCDRMGVLVWEESLGWGNGQGYTSGGKNAKFPPNELTDPEWCEMQVKQTRDMVRASFNHPSVIISAFLNEPACNTRPCKEIIDRLIATIKAERTGRLVTFACSIPDSDICNENTDIVAFNVYPCGIPPNPGTPKELKEKTEKCFNEKIRNFRKKYPEKPIMVSETGTGGMYGVHDPNGSPNTEEHQDEYLRDVLETLWANPDCVGLAIWQMNDGRTRERYCTKSVSAMFGGSIAGCFDQMRRPKKSIDTVREFFSRR